MEEDYGDVQGRYFATKKPRIALENADWKDLHWIGSDNCEGTEQVVSCRLKMGSY